MNSDRRYGASVEIGMVTAQDGDRYTVASITRMGVTTPPIASMQDGISAGDRVYFFLFPDGNGMILNKMGGD